MKLMTVPLLIGLLVLPELGYSQRGRTNKTSTKESRPEVKEGTSIPEEKPDCQQNDPLNKLLLSLLLSSVTMTTQNPLMANLNALLGVSSAPMNQINQIEAVPRTQVITSTAISTVTQLYSTVLSVLFKNKRIPTTIYNSETVVVTELTTTTVTVEPTATLAAPFRLRREEHPRNEDNEISASFFDHETVAHLIRPTRPLPIEPTPLAADEKSADVQQWIDILNHPRVRKAWNHFLSELENVRLEN